MKSTKLLHDRYVMDLLYTLSYLSVTNIDDIYKSYTHKPEL